MMRIVGSFCGTAGPPALACGRNVSMKRSVPSAALMVVLVVSLARS